MEPWQTAVLIKPFALLILFALLFVFVRWPIQKYMPEGKLKRLLLRRIN